MKKFSFRHCCFILLLLLSIIIDKVGPNMRVAKFGGSSLSNATQIKKVATIIQNEPEINYIVVSAPGKRDAGDTKVTDMLIALCTNKTANLDVAPIIENILKRYAEIITDLQLDQEILTSFKKQLHHYLETIEQPEYLLDALKSCGEDFNAHIVSEYLKQIGLDAKYMSPKDVGITMTDNPGNAQLIHTSYQKIQALKNAKEVLVIPGFFGYTKAGDIVTFSRGGSDITGAIIARGVNAESYENFTDVSHIYSAHPGIVSNPHPISKITYREIRELSYSGFNVFHDEALQPLYEVKIPVNIRNTNQPELKGTQIVSDREDVFEYPVAGISGDGGFLSITIKRYLLNREVGFMRSLLQIFEDYDLSVEHIPTGIDDISVILRKNQLTDKKQFDQLLADIQKEFNPEWIHVEEDLALIAVAGEGMRNTIGVANKATKGFMNAKVSLRMINQGASEVSMFFTIPAKDLNEAIQSLYKQYFDD